MPILIAAPSPVSRAGGSLSPLSAPAGRTRFPGLAVSKVESAGFVGWALPTAGSTAARYFWKRRDFAEEGWAGVADEHALKRCYSGSPPVR